MNTIKRSILIATIAATFLVVGCGVDTPDAPELAGTAPTQVPTQFSNYVAIGNSLTAGFMDGGLVSNGQSTSFPMLMATAMGYTATSFTQPYISFPGVGTSDTGSPFTAAGVLYFDGTTTSVAGVTGLTDVPDLLLADAWPFPYNNLGVPGATLFDATNATASTNSQSPGNSYFDLILRNPIFANTTMVEQGTSIGPTLMTVWLGNNDILGGATSGTPVLGGNVTPSAAFTTMYEALLDGLLAATSDAVIICANIPDIASIPYFMTTTTFEMMIGSPMLYEEADAGFVRLPALSEVQSAGFAPPLGAEFTLSAAEAILVDTAVGDYNTAIAAAVAARADVHLFDANAMMNATTAHERTHFLALLGAGMDVETAAATTLFSLDGIHPNNRGYARVAGGFIGVLNAALGTSFTAVPEAAISWDPTYGQPPAAKTDGPLLSPAAATGVDAIFR